MSQTNPPNRTDIAIVGAGPAGLSAAVNAIARGKSVRVFSAGSNVLDKAEAVDNYLGFYHLTGTALMDRFREHAAALRVVPEKGRVGNIFSMGDHFLLNLGSEIAEATSVIVATGVAVSKEIPGEGVLLGRGVSYCATCDGMLYRGKRAVVWGLSPEAPEEANFLHSIGVGVTYVSRGERPHGLHEDIAFLAGGVSEIVGDDRVTAVKAGNTILDTDVVFILRSSIAPANLVAGLETDGGFIRVNEHKETNIPGLFAAGDCIGIPLQVAKAVSDGLIAALQAAKYVTALSKQGSATT